MRLSLATVFVLLTACGEPDAPPTPWEIVRGTAALTGSADVVPDTRAPIATYSSRTGSLTVADDSTVTGWIRLAVGDTAHITTGMVSAEGDSLLMTLPDLAPAEYVIFTSPSFPHTYGLVSTTIINSDVTGDSVPEQHRVYWEFSR